MRSSWTLVSLLLVSVLIHEAQGIRVRKGTPPDRQQKIHKILQEKRSNDGVEEVNPCKAKHCRSGRVRKLVMTPTSSTTTATKTHKKEENKAHDPKLEGSSSNEKFARNEENFLINSSSTTEQRQPARKTYPDILDLAGMDYSQARRKPPIHN